MHARAGQLPSPPPTRTHPHCRPQEVPDVSTPGGKVALLKRFQAQLAEWGPLLQRFLRSEDDQARMRGRAID